MAADDQQPEPGSLFDFQGSVASAGVDGTGFHHGWRAAEHEQGVSLLAPWEDPFAGFPEHCRRIARALDDTGMHVHLRSIDPSIQFQQRFKDSGGVEGQQMIADYDDLLTKSVKSYLVGINYCVASDTGLQRLVTHQFLDPEQLAFQNKLKIIGTVFERDRISEAAVMFFNQVAQVWVANNKDHDMLVRCGVHQSRVRVVPIPFFPNHPTLKLRGRKRKPGPVRFYHIGKWEHRKAHHEMLGAFMLAFKPGEAKLYFKTSTVAPDFGDYPSDPMVSILRWCEDEIVKHNGWTRATANQDIKLIKRRIPLAMIQQLHDIGDVYISLSRGEGFDMPAYDAKLAGNLMVYTPSGGPQDFASPLDIMVPSSGTVPCHSFYKWDDAHYLKHDVNDAAQALRKAAEYIKVNWDTGGHDLSVFSAEAVGAKMRIYIDEVLADCREYVAKLRARNEQEQP